MIKIKNKIISLLVVLCIAALLAVPILAKPDKQVQNNPKFSSIEVVGEDVNSTVSLEKATAKGKLKQQSKKNIKMGSLLATGTGDAEQAAASGKMKLEKVGNKMKIHVPQGQETKNQARMKLKDMSGEDIAELIAEFDGELTESEQNRLEKGQASLRSIKSLRLVSREDAVEVSDSKGNKHKVKAHVNVGLNSINEDSSLDITTDNELEEDIAGKYEAVAKKNKLKLKNRGGVMQVDKINLKNGVEVEEATVTFKVEPEWVGEENINDVVILRYDEGYTEVLPTEFAGVDEEGMLIFEGDSENGLSTFAVFMTENISDVDDTSFDLGALKGFLLPLLIIVTVGAAFVGSVIRREHK